MIPRGIRNNNPLNIRHNADLFQGEIRPGTDRGFKQFQSAAFGYRAAFVMLGTYLARGLNTVKKIIYTWAPPVENDTEGYIDKVEKWSGVNRDKTMGNDSGEDYVKIVLAMSRVENGIPAVETDVRSGFNMQHKLK